MELMSRWEDFGMKFRGLWNPDEVIYNENDVVNHIVNGQEGYFVCRMDHISEKVLPPDVDKDCWKEYDEEGRLKKKVHPHNLL